MNVNVRSLYGVYMQEYSFHKEKQYHMDNTWTITRNKNCVDEILKASSLSGEYLLFDMTTSNIIGH